MDVVVERNIKKKILFLLCLMPTLSFNTERLNKQFFKVFFFLALTNSKFPAYERVVLKAGEFEIIIEKFILIVF
jgi:hypothetical protein